jgi:L-iditol 2-dehydrogenase
MLIGMGVPIQTLAISSAALREVDLVGVFRYANTYPEGISLASSPSCPDLSKLVTHKFKGLESAEQAFGMAGRTKDDKGDLVLKVVIANWCSCKEELADALAKVVIDTRGGEKAKL